MSTLTQFVGGSLSPFNNAGLTVARGVTIAKDFATSPYLYNYPIKSGRHIEFSTTRSGTTSIVGADDATDYSILPTSLFAASYEFAAYAIDDTNDRFFILGQHNTTATTVWLKEINLSTDTEVAGTSAITITNGTALNAAADAGEVAVIYDATNVTFFFTNSGVLYKLVIKRSDGTLVSEAEFTQNTRSFNSFSPTYVSADETILARFQQSAGGTAGEVANISLSIAIAGKLSLHTISPGTDVVTYQFLSSAKPIHFNHDGSYVCAFTPLNAPYVRGNRFALTTEFDAWLTELHNNQVGA